MCFVVQYSDGVEYADLCFNATLVQATRVNKEVSYRHRSSLTTGMETENEF